MLNFSHRMASPEASSIACRSCRNCASWRAARSFITKGASITHAQNLEPLSLPIKAGLGWHYYLTRRYGEASNEYRQTLDMEQNFYLARFLLAMAYVQVSMYDAALVEYQRANELVGGSPPMLAGMGYVYAKLGQVERAQQVLSELHQLAQQRYVSPYYIAVIYTALGDRAQAFAWLVGSNAPAPINPKAWSGPRSIRCSIACAPNRSSQTSCGASG